MRDHVVRSSTLHSLGLGISANSVYKPKAFLYKYTDSLYKAASVRSVRVPGYELSDLESPPHVFVLKGEGGHDTKLPASISRTRSKVFELAICNSWEYFATLTFSPEKVADRYDLEANMKSLRKWINNQNNRHCDGKLAYLLIPEKHKDGAWHVHGLFSGIPAADLRKFQDTEKLPAHILSEIRKGHDILQWLPYDRKFGYCTLSPVRSPEAVSKYITKYITKDLGNSVDELNAHLYYCSQGLKSKEIVYSSDYCYIPDPDFESDYCMIKWSDTPEPLLACFATD